MEGIWDVWAQKGSPGDEMVISKMGPGVCTLSVRILEGKFGAEDRKITWPKYEGDVPGDQGSLDVIVTFCEQ